MAIYNLKTHKRQARPRSKRLQELGVSSATAIGGSVVTINSGGVVTPGNTHYHANKAALDQITTDADGYQYLTRLVENEDGTTQEVTEKVKAGYADYAGSIPPEMLANLPFISKLADDVAKGSITFEQMITVLGLSVFRGGAQFGEFVDSLSAGSGAGIDEFGNATFESVRVRSYFESLEIIINRLSAIEGDQVLTESDVIEDVEILDDNRYRLYLRRKWDGYITAQVRNNILRGVTNDISSGGGYMTSWMRVDRVNTRSNYIDVSMYNSADTPSGTNYPPTELMRITRWGNSSDTTRQSCIYLSSTEGRIVRLTGVNAPKLTAANYGMTVGTLPEFLTAMNLPIIDGQDYLYARGIVVQDIIRIDYQGNPKAEIVDRGQWQPTETYYCNALNPTTQTYETSDVWHYGCRFRCSKNGTRTEPEWGNTDWSMVEGNPEFMVGFKEDVVFCNPSNFNAKLTLVVKAYNKDITETINDDRVRWTRYSLDSSGSERSYMDTIWYRNRGDAGKVLSLTLADLDYDELAPPSLVRFTVSVVDDNEPIAEVPL